MAILSNERMFSGEPVLLFKKWMAKSKIGMLGCDFGVSSEFAAGKQSDLPPFCFVFSDF